MKHHRRRGNSLAFPVVLSCALFLLAGCLMGQQSASESKGPKKISASSIQIDNRSAQHIHSIYVFGRQSMLGVVVQKNMYFSVCKNRHLGGTATRSIEP